MNKKIAFALIPLVALTIAFKPAEKHTRADVLHLQNKKTDTTTSITGVWRMDLVQDGNTKLTTYFILHQDSDKFTGNIIINNASKLSFRKPHFEGNEAVFGTSWNRDYRLRREGDKLHVKIVYYAGGSDEAYAVRASISETNPPALIPLPALAPVPSNHLAQLPLWVGTAGTIFQAG
jgi:hypothetical protein